MNKQKIAAVIVIIAIALTIHCKLLIDRDAIPYADASDTLLSGVFMENFIASSVSAHHELPLWNPYIWSGSPMTGNTQSGLFYPPAWIFILLPFALAMKLYYISHTIIAGILMYFLARELRLGHVPSMISSFIFMTTGSVYALNVHHFFSNFILWLPGAILFYRLAVRKMSYGYAILAGLLISIQFMGSHPQLFVFSMIYLSAFCITDMYVAWRKERKLRNMWTSFRYAAIAAAFAVGLVLFEILNMVQFSSMSTRVNASGLSFASEISIAPEELLSLFTHPAVGGGVILFIGIVPLFLVIASLFGNMNREKKFFLIAGLLSLVYALGKYSLLFYLVYYLLPVFRMFRNPFYALFFFGLSLSILSGYGAQYLFVEIRNTIYEKHSTRKLCESTTIAAVGLSIFAIIYLTSKAQFTSAIPQLSASGTTVYAGVSISDIYTRTGANMLILGTIILGCLAVLIFLKQRRTAACSGICSIVIISLLVVELLSANIMFLRTADADQLLSGNELTEFLSENSYGYRVLNMGGDRILCQTLAATHGIRLADGYDPMMLNEYQIFMNSAADISTAKAGTKLQLSNLCPSEIKNWRALDMLGVKYILSPGEVNGTKLKLATEYHNIKMYSHNKGMFTVPHIFVYENPDAVSQVFVSIDGENVIPAELKHIDNRKATASIQSYSPNRINAEAEFAVPGMLVFSELWYPGWKAYVDGKEREVLKTEGVLRGVRLDPGRHNVELVFQPALYIYGRYISLATLMLAAIYMVLRKTLRTVKVEVPASN